MVVNRILSFEPQHWESPAETIRATITPTAPEDITCTGDNSDDQNYHMVDINTTKNKHN